MFIFICLELSGDNTSRTCFACRALVSFPFMHSLIHSFIRSAEIPSAAAVCSAVLNVLGVKDAEAGSLSSQELILH